jgi:hypothetical protein
MPDGAMRRAPTGRAHGTSSIDVRQAADYRHGTLRASLSRLSAFLRGVVKKVSIEFCVV